MIGAMIGASDFDWAKGGAKIRYFRGADELDEAEYITKVARAAIHDDFQGSFRLRNHDRSRTR